MLEGQRNSRVSPDKSPPPIVTRIEGRCLDFLPGRENDGYAYNLALDGQPVGLQIRATDDGFALYVLGDTGYARYRDPEVSAEEAVYPAVRSAVTAATRLVTTRIREDTGFTAFAPPGNMQLGF